MKNYTVLDPQHDFKAIQDFIVELDNQIWSLVDYIRNFTPNYHILNTKISYVDQGKQYYVSYYTEDELSKTANNLGIIDQTNNKLTASINYLPKNYGLYNNFAKIPKDQRFWTDEHGTTKLWPEGTVIINRTKNTLPWEDAPEYRYYQKDSYFIARLSAAATFYRFHYNGLAHQWVWDYFDKAEESYGTTFLTTLIPCQPRFFLKDGWQEYRGTDLQKRFASYNKTGDSYIGNIITKQNSIWTDSYLLNHEVIWKSNDWYGEDCICDDVSVIQVTNIDSLKVPTYNIIIKGEKASGQDTNLYVQLW